VTARRLKDWPLDFPAVCGVGSLPHRSVSDAAAFVREHCAAARFVPELPSARGGRGMIASLRTPPRAQERGLAGRIGAGAEVLKSQLCGPATFAKETGVSLRAAERAVAARIEEIVANMRAAAPRARLVVVLDEPHLGGVKRADPAVVSIRRLLGRVRKLGGLAGIHCCDHADASVVAALDPDLYSFDAWSGLETTLEAAPFRRWLRRGRLLALGIAPTTPSRTSASNLANRIRAAFAAAQLDLRSQPVLLTGACGFGRSTRSWTDRAHRLLKRTALLLAE
jgi:hypothetical protein